MKAPHLLFMLNNEGYTPLDICILEGNTEKAELLI
jgi:ankyrin repeat protein